MTEPMDEATAKARLAAAGWEYTGPPFLALSGPGVIASALRGPEYREVSAEDADQARALLVASVEQEPKLRDVIARAVARMNAGRCNSKAIADTLAILKEASDG
jgi:hypothetical protein